MTVDIVNVELCVCVMQGFKRCRQSDQSGCWLAKGFLSERQGSGWIKSERA